MDQLTVTIDGTDHKIGAGEITLCNLPVPFGSKQDEKAKECKVCFAKDVNLQEHVDARRIDDEVPTPLASDSEEAAPKKAKAK